MEKVTVMIPSVTNKPIVSEVVRTFGSDVKIKILHLTDIVVNNYASEELVDNLRKQINDNIQKWYDTTKHDDEEVYLILTGGILQAIIATTKLDNLGVSYKFLVFERKLRKYVGLTREGELDKEFIEQYLVP